MGGEWHRGKATRLSFVASAIRLLRINSTLFLPINRAYRLVHRSITPVTGVGNFASNLRYGTKIEISLFDFPIGSRGSDRKLSIVRQRLNERHCIWGKCSAAIY